MFESLVSFGKYGQWVAAITGSSIVFISGNLCAWPAAALPKIVDGTAGFSLTTDEQAWVVSTLYIGAVLSPIPGSFLMDKLGRRNILMLISAASVITWIMLRFATTAIPIYVARVLSGMYCGIEYTVLANFIAEVVDPGIRGAVGTLMSIMFCAGAFFVSLISFCEYDSIIYICLGVSSCVLFCFLFLPETPYFHLMHKKRKAAEKSVVWLRGSCGPNDLDRIEEKIREQLENSASYLDIFRNAVVLKAFAMVEVLKLVSSSCSSVFLMTYASLIVPPSWVSPKESYVVLCTSWVITGLASTLIMDKFNRRTIMLISCGGSFVGLVCSSIWYYLRDFTTVDVSGTNWIPLVTIVVTTCFEVLGLFNIPNIYKGEVFPINVKSKACALSCVTACFFEGVANYVFLPINENIGIYFNFVKSAITTLIGILFTIFIMVETKGKSLEDIQDILNKKKRENNEKMYELPE